MNRTTGVFLGLMFVAFTATMALADKGPFIFPKEGQSQEQLTQDKSYCESWAQDESGIDPKVVLAKKEMVKEEEEEARQLNKGGKFLGSLVKGAAAGAATGALDKAIDNEVGSGAAKGTVIGGIFGYEKIKAEEKEIKKDTRQSTKEELAEQYDSYLRAFSVCMEAKGYHVK